MKTVPEMHFINARIVTPDRVINGSLHVDRTGHISDIRTGNGSAPGGHDCEGAYLIPGLVELHTDNLEKHFSPRPGVTWPAKPATIAHDSQVVAAGITTVFDAISLGDVIQGSLRKQHLKTMVEALKKANDNAHHRADHFLHLRCEVSCESALPLFEELVNEPFVRLVSIMDHSPGQRQFANPDKYREYYQGKYGFSDEALETFIERQVAASQRFSAPYREQITRFCQERGLPMASHDDATEAHVEESAGFGMSVAEFPTTLEAARLSHRNGMKVLMGAPNIVRGGSHSGNVAAADLAKEGVLDILSSDYYPGSLLDAAFRLVEEDNHYDLPSAIQTVSLTPADSVGLTDRGSLSPGKRADLLWVSCDAEGHPHIRQAWKLGQRIF